MKTRNSGVVVAVLLSLGVAVYAESNCGGLCPGGVCGPKGNAAGESLKVVLADKKLDPAVVKSLGDRGKPEVYSGKKLKWIGMPIGGICAGQLYLGGDGKLWHWDIFNKHIGTGAGHYAHPMIPSSPLEQGFVLRIGDKAWALDQTGFSNIQFRGEYPMVLIEYQDDAAPVAVTLKAFSPFIPLNTDDSSLPATVFQFTVRNTSKASVEADLVGMLENAVCLNNRKHSGLRKNQVLKEQGYTFLNCSAAPQAGASDEKVKLVDLPDFGTMGLALLGAPADKISPEASVQLSAKLVGEVGRKLTLKKGQSATVSFVLAWYFPNLDMTKGLKGRYYAAKFRSAQDVAGYIVGNFDKLVGETQLWHDTWYDSSLPYWFLDRTMLNNSILASSTCYRFQDGRFYAWEGVGCCAGTCGHVWHYAHGPARLFPDLERDLRERVDFGLAQKPNGAIIFRGEFGAIPAVDAQAGSILRAYREHQMSANDAFLRRNWPKIKLAMDYLIAKDKDDDGLIEDGQHNTLDTDWHGKVAWLSGLYNAALRAAAEMAVEMGDAPYAKRCRTIADAGRANMVTELFDGEYFINKVNTNHLAAINSGTGCEIDQVMGQSWAWQVGLDRVFPKAETLSALKSLWKYNFITDVGPYRKENKPGRWYAMPGESGLLMCTFPRGDWDYAKARGQGKTDWAAGYFNECMNGFEYQVAGHMIWEGMVQEGLVVTWAVHERYCPCKRNPYNEIECGDHYARSMASYGVYLAACGFSYHGPKGQIGFAPRLKPENFKAAFTAAEGWGSYSQTISGNTLTATMELRYGALNVKEFAVELPEGVMASELVAKVDGSITATTFTQDGRQVVASFQAPLRLKAGQSLALSIK